MKHPDSIFTKILKGEVPGDIIYQDDAVFAIKDIQPQAPVHLLIIPKARLHNIDELTADSAILVGRIVFVAKQLARAFGIAESGYRLVFNNGADAGQTVNHLHCHLLGGTKLDN